MLLDLVLSSMPLFDSVALPLKASSDSLFSCSLSSTPDSQPRLLALPDLFCVVSPSTNIHNFEDAHIKRRKREGRTTHIHRALWYPQLPRLSALSELSTLEKRKLPNIKTWNKDIPPKIQMYLHPRTWDCGTYTIFTTLMTWNLGSVTSIILEVRIISSCEVENSELDVR
jgi:hypothetical protein